MSDVLSPWVTLIEAEVNLLMAIGTTITGTAVYYGGFLAAEFIARNRRKLNTGLPYSRPSPRRGVS